MSGDRSRPVLTGLACLAVVLAIPATAAPTAVPDAWQRTVFENIQRAEYEFSPAADGSWSAPNRTHDLRSFVSADGLRVIPRRPAEPTWELRLSLAGLGRAGAMIPAETPAGSPAARGNRAELHRTALTEWFVNEPSGLEHGYTLSSRPPGGEGELILQLALAGTIVADLSPDGATVRFRTATGHEALRYDKLEVFDATGRRLDSRFELEGDRLSMVIDDARADYPLLVDPVVSDPDWSHESNQSSSRYGLTVASLGDVNGDGFADVAVGAEQFDNTPLDEGMVFVYYGSPSGPSATPSWTAESDHAGARFGRALASAGDINNDGYDDVIIGAPEYDDDDGSLTEEDEGWAFVFLGSSTGLPGGPNATVLDAVWNGESNQSEAAYGRAVASAGDVNADGYDDIVIGASEYTNDQDFEGTAFLYLGSATGLGPTGTPANAVWQDEGNQVNGLYAHAISSAGDVNNDGRDDVLVGQRNYEGNFSDEGRVYLYLGAGDDLADTPVWVLDGGERDMRLGVSVASAGDVNGDGFDDVLIGADIYSNPEVGEGGAFVFAGSQTAQLGTSPAWTGEINQGDAFYGFSVSGAGDVNGDGFDDVIVGSDSYDNLELDEGSAFLYFGSESGLPTGPSRSFEVDQAGARLGVGVAGAGDVNGDGFDDVIVGADLFTKLQAQEGAAFVFFGCLDAELDGVCRADDNCPDLFNPDQADTDLDGLGDVCDPCQDIDLDSVCDVPRVLIESSGPGEEVLVQFGSPMRYLANEELVNPGIILEWTELSFPDELFPPWAVGIYGVGYETDAFEGAGSLLLTTNPPNPGSVSVFTRAQFVIDDVAEVETLFLGVDWDDGYVAWINGVEVFRSTQMPAGVPFWNTPATAGHESSNGAVPDYGVLNDISFSGIPALKVGLNVLAIGVWNTNAGSTDLVLVPRLSMNRPKSSTTSYWANNAPPAFGDSWTLKNFNEVANGWSPGNYGVGFDTAGDAADLINAEVPPDTVSVFTRARVSLNPSTVESVFVGGDYDDAYGVWINGMEVFRSPELPGTPGVVPPWNADPSPVHESSNGAVPDYGVLTDITTVAGAAFVQGENVVAIGGWTGSGDTDDLVLVPRLSINEGNVDNCIGEFNPDQADQDEDGIGDACDPDIDGDGVNNASDNCPTTSNAPSDCDNDGGTPDEQCDLDADGIGDVCDACPDDANNDGDGDGVCEGTGFGPPKIGDGDNCPTDFNPPEDCDGNGGTPDEQCDTDTDGIGDVCDGDLDGDGVDNGVDNCPTVSNPPSDCDANGGTPDEQCDGDSDGFGDVCDCAAGDGGSWEVPSALDSVQMAKKDLCGNFSCSESGGVCAADTECNFDYCAGQACTMSLGPCSSDAECEVDTCENFLCTDGGNPCNTDVDCTADFCTGRTCTEGMNGCTGDVDCTADFCENKMCLETNVPCDSIFDCFGTPGLDLCIGQCSIGGNLCAADQSCVMDVCGDGTCSEGGNVCSDDSLCTSDVCEGACSVGANACTDDSVCTAPQIDLCEGLCSLGENVCSTDVQCTAPQTDLCLGACTIGTNQCTSDSACTQPAIDTLFWQDPSDLGGTGVVYDTIRSAFVNDFINATCVETDGADRLTSDATPPSPGSVQFYLIRVENACPEGNLGSGAGGPRTGLTCE